MAKQLKQIGRPSYLKPSPYHICNQCGVTKSEKEFYKCKARPTGLQAKCKECCKQDGLKFRNENPQYYTGNDTSYFVKNREQWNSYLKQFLKCDKPATIYSIETPHGLYIGCTHGYLWNRMKVHRRDYRRHQKGLPGSRIPLLHNAWDKMGGEEWLKTLLDVRVIEEFPKDITQSQLLTLEKQYIKKFESQGITLLNSVGTTNPSK